MGFPAGPGQRQRVPVVHLLPGLPAGAVAVGNQGLAVGVQPSSHGGAVGGDAVTVPPLPGGALGNGQLAPAAHSPLSLMVGEGVDQPPAELPSPPDLRPRPPEVEQKSPELSVARRADAGAGYFLRVGHAGLGLSPVGVSLAAMASRMRSSRVVCRPRWYFRHIRQW